jgi:twitching motility protein PilT
MMRSSQIRMNDLMDVVVDEGASDLHISVDLPPTIRLHGRLHPLDSEPLRPEDTQRLMKEITPEDHQGRLERNRGSDFGISHGTRGRYRVSVFMQRGSIGMVLRLLPTRLMTLEEIGLPPAVKDLLFKPRGLILVTGPTGSGKTTTLASMLNVINEERDCHIITVEDPIEYFHHHKKSIITQRELDVDVPSFSEAIKRGLRQDPDVMLVGEMRDLETMEAAITAAETGHLVFATLHTTGAARTVDRIVDAFPQEQQDQIRIQLASTLEAVISQLLLIREDKPGRVAAFEIMINTPSIRSLIRDNKTFRITSDIQTGAKWGMMTLDAHLMTLFEKGLLGYEEVITSAQDVDSTVEKLQTIKVKRR